MKKNLFLLLPFWIFLFSSNILFGAVDIKTKTKEAPTVSFGVVDTKLKSKEVLITQKKEQQKRSKKGFFKRLKGRFSFRERRTKNRDLKTKKKIMRHTMHARSFSKWSKGFSWSFLPLALHPPLFIYFGFILIPLFLVNFLLGLLFAVSALNKIRKDKTGEDYSKTKKVTNEALDRSIDLFFVGILIIVRWYMLIISL